MEQPQMDEKPAYEPPAVAEIAEFSELTTDCGFQLLRVSRPAQRVLITLTTVTSPNE